MTEKHLERSNADLIRANAPAALRALPQWVCWRQETRDGKPTKVPYAAATNRKASSTNSATWASFEDALGAFVQGNFLGVGFVFAENGMVGVDLDHCLRQENGAFVLHPDAERIVRTLDSYTEISPSGDGLHVLLLGKKPSSSCAKPDMPWGGECAFYEKSRYFVMTGNLLPGYPTEIRPRQEALTAVMGELWPSAEAKGQIARELKASGLSVR